MNTSLLSTGVIADGSSNANEVDISAINTELTASGADLATRINKYNSWMGVTFTLNTNNELTMSNVPSEYTQESAINVLKFVASTFPAGTEDITVNLKVEFTAQRSTLESYQLILAWDGTSAYKITPLSYDLVAGTPIAVA